MAASPSTPLILAIDIQLHQLSALVFDPSSKFDPVSKAGSAEHSASLLDGVLWQRRVNFDTEFPAFQTQRGSYTPPPSEEEYPQNAALTPVGVIVRALDTVLQELKEAAGPHDEDRARPTRRQADEGSGTSLMSRIGTIGLSGAVNVPILLSNTAIALLNTLQPTQSLTAQIGCPSFFATPFVPNIKDWTLDTEAAIIQSAFDELDEMMAQLPELGAMQELSLLHQHKETMGRDRLLRLRFAAALLRFRLSAEKEAGNESSAVSGAATAPPWHRLGGVTTMAGLVYALLVGRVPRWQADEAAAAGFYHYALSGWDQALLSIISGVTGLPLDAVLGPLDDGANQDGTPLGAWAAQRFSFARDCKVMLPMTSQTALASACMLEKGDGILTLGLDDELVVAVECDNADIHLGSIVLLPFNKGRTSHDKCQSSRPRFLAVAHRADAGIARQIIRSTYCNDRWPVLSRLINAVPPGGSIGLDDKLFTRVISRDGIQDIRRYERGCRVTEFSDLRANARCLVEGQAMAVRADLVRARTRACEGYDARAQGQGRGQETALGIRLQGALLGVDETTDLVNGDHATTTPPPTRSRSQPPRAPRLFALGKPLGNKTLASIWSGVLGSPLLVPAEYLAVQEEEHSRQGQMHGHGSGQVSRAGQGRAQSGSTRHDPGRSQAQVQAQGTRQPSQSSTHMATTTTTTTTRGGPTGAPCRLLIGTALRALALRWADSGAGCGPGLPVEDELRPGVRAVLAYFGKVASFHSHHNDDTTHESDDGDATEGDSGPPSVMEMLECKQVAYLELSKVYAALAEEHERLRGVGDVGGRYAPGDVPPSPMT